MQKIIRKNPIKNRPTTGCVSEVLSGRIGGIFFRNTVSLVGLSSLFYFFIWLAIRFMKGGWIF